MTEPPIFSPRDFLSFLASRRKVPPHILTIPPRLLVTFHRDSFDYTRRRIRGRYLDWYYNKRLAVGTLRDVSIAALYAFIGSSAAVMMLEEMIAAGARMVVEVGLCGGVAPSVQVGDIIIVKRSFVDEGTSSHYFRNAKSFPAPDTLLRKLEEALKEEGVQYRIGGIWTTDAPYRETQSKLAKFRNQGAFGVNMETSALFALGGYRHIDVASVQVVSDLLTENEWQPLFSDRKVRENLSLAAKLASSALVSV